MKPACHCAKWRSPRDSAVCVGSTTRSGRPTGERPRHCLAADRSHRIAGARGLIGVHRSMLRGPEMMDEVLRRADYVVIATAETTGAIGRRELALMKPSAFLINVARA